MHNANKWNFSRCSSVGHISNESMIQPLTFKYCLISAAYQALSIVYKKLLNAKYGKQGHISSVALLSRNGLVDSRIFPQI